MVQFAPTAQTPSTDPLARAQRLAALIEATPAAPSRPSQSIGEAAARGIGVGLNAYRAAKLAGAEGDARMSQATSLADIILPGGDPNDPKRQALINYVAGGGQVNDTIMRSLGLGAPAEPIIHEVYDPATGQPSYSISHDGGNTWQPFGGTKSDTMSPDAEAQKIRIAEAGRTQINNNLGPSGIDYGDPPKDMSWARDAEGNIILQPDPDTGYSRPVAVPIAGGPIEQDQLAADKAAEMAKTQKTTAADIVVTDADRVISLIENDPFWTTGFVGNLLQDVGSTSANNVRTLMNTLKANVGFDKLQAMRDASPTGGALGQVSERENTLLQSAIGSLEQSQTKDQLVDNIKRVKNIYLDIIHGPGNGPKREMLTYEKPTGAPSPGDVMDGYRFKGGDPADQNNWEKAQ